MTETPEPPPEAQLIEQNRKTRTRLSIRKAAEHSGISEGRWRQIAKGYTSVAAGVKAPAIAPDVTLSRMALASQTTADELESAGRADAAELVRQYWQGNSMPLMDTAPHVTLADASDAEILDELKKRLKQGGLAIQALTPAIEGDDDHERSAAKTRAGGSPAPSEVTVEESAPAEPPPARASTPLPNPGRRGRGPS